MENIIPARYFKDIWKLYTMLGVRAQKVPMFDFYRDDIIEFYLMIKDVQFDGITFGQARRNLTRNAHLVDKIYTTICNNYKFEKKEQTLVFSKNSMLRLCIDDSEKGTVLIKLPRADEDF